MRRRAALAALAVTALGAGGAAPARAAFELAAPAAAPAQAQAGAHSDVRFHVEPRGGRIRDLDVLLPPGLVGNPQATPKCPVIQFSTAECPPETQVGSSMTQATVDPLGLPQSAPGRIYNLEPRAGEPARLGVRIEAPGGGEPQRLQATVRMRPEDNGLTSELRDLPRRAGGFDVTITSLDIVLSERFMTNPTSCAPAETRFVARAYDSDERAEARASFTPAACEALPFAPRFEAVMGGAGLTGAGAVPELTTVVAQAPGEANVRSVAVTMPPDVGIGIDRLGRACPGEQFAAAACPPDAEIGTATAETPLLTAPLAGPVSFVLGQATLPDLVLTLRGPIGLTLRGATELGAGGLTTTFAGLPDVPLSRFALAFKAGDAGVLALNRDLCAGPAPRLAASFTAQSGRAHAVTVPAIVSGCRPRAVVELGALRRGRPSLRVRVDAGDGRLRQTVVRVPRGLALRRGARLRVTGGGSRGARTSRSRRRVTIRHAGIGARSVALRVRPGGLRVARRLRARRPALAFRVTTVDVGGARLRQTIKARPERR